MPISVFFFGSLHEVATAPSRFTRLAQCNVLIRFALIQNFRGDSTPVRLVTGGFAVLRNMGQWPRGSVLDGSGDAENMCWEILVHQIWLVKELQLVWTPWAMGSPSDGQATHRKFHT